MNRTVLVLLAALLPAGAAAQSFSAVERSLIEAIEDCWSEATTNMSMQALTDACGATEATTYWWTPEATPFVLLSPWVEASRDSWNRTVLAQDLRPIRVQVDGDFGFIYFYAIRIWESATGERETESWRGFEVWKRVGGDWSFVGGTGTPDALNQIAN